MNKIAKQIETPTNVVSIDPMLALIERVIVDPELPIERIQAVLDLRERQMNKDAEIQFNQAFAEMMAEMPTIPRTGKSNRNTYSTIDDIVNTTRPVLSCHGFSLNWEAVTDVEKRTVQVTAVVRHKLGHTISTTHNGGFDKNGDNDNQKARSTETYLKRYSATSILGLSTGEEKEDDGAASNTINADQFIALRDKIKLAGIDVSLVLQAHRATSLEEFPSNQFNAAMKRLDKDIVGKG